MTIEAEIAPRAAASNWASPWVIPVLCVVAAVGAHAIAVLAIGQGFSLRLLIQMFCRWDTGYYLDIAAENYRTTIAPAGQPSWPFFPLLPAATALVEYLTSFSGETSGTVVAMVSLLLSCRLARELCTSRRQYVLFCAAIAFGPASLYFTIPYSESLFLLFTIVLQRQIRNDSYIGAGIAGAMLSTSRAVGIFAGVAILVRILLQYRRGNRRWSDLPAYLWGNPATLLGLALVPLGLGAFVLVLYLRTGDGLAFVHAQQLWYRQMANPLAAVWSGLGSNPNTKIAAWSAIGGIALSIVLLVRRQYEMAAFCAFCVIAPLTMGVGSMYRFVISLAPFWFLLAELVATRRWLTWIAVPALFAAGVSTDIAWLNGVHYLV